MAIKFSSTLYQSKPGMLGQVNMGEIVKKIGADVGPGVAVNTSKAAKALKKAIDGRKKGKFLDAVVTVGMVGKHMTFGITSKKEEEKVALVENYEKVKAAASQGPAVVNADVGDDTIDEAVKDYARAKKGKVVKGKLDKPGDKQPIVIVAHGDKAVSKGKVYAKNFADKTPDELVKFLVKDKKLPKNYAGVFYLDGCFTAAGKTDKNFTKKVYEKLNKLGYKYIQVKGNLGRSATDDDGSEVVLDAQEQRRMEKKVKKAFDATVAKLVKAEAKAASSQLVWDTVWTNSYADADDVDGFYEDAKIKKLTPILEKLEKEVKTHNKAIKKLQADYKDITRNWDHRIVDLVGTFGPEKLKKDSRFKKIFS